MTRAHLGTFRAARDAAPHSAALVTLVARRGSAPQELCATLLASADGQVQAGTIGGGRLEAWALRTAAALLASPQPAATLARVNLQRDIGMTCGGEVQVLFEPLGPAAAPWLSAVVDALAVGAPVTVTTHLATGQSHAERAASAHAPVVARAADSAPATVDPDGQTVRRTLDPAAGWAVTVFGAGHVAQAVTRLLLTLDCRLTVLDTRPEWIARLPQDPLLSAQVQADLPAQVDRLGQRDFVVVMTQGHTTDLPVLARALARPFPNSSRGSSPDSPPDGFPYVGVLGSRTKADRLRRELLALGCAPERVEALRCPIGLPLGRSTPPEIAVSVVAELLSARGSPESARWRPR